MHPLSFPSLNRMYSVSSSSLTYFLFIYYTLCPSYPSHPIPHLYPFLLHPIPISYPYQTLTTTTIRLLHPFHLLFASLILILFLFFSIPIPYHTIPICTLHAYIHASHSYTLHFYPISILFPFISFFRPFHLHTTCFPFHLIQFTYIHIYTHPIPSPKLNSIQLNSTQLKCMYSFSFAYFVLCFPFPLHFLPHPTLYPPFTLTNILSSSHPSPLLSNPIQ